MSGPRQLSAQEIAAIQAMTGPQPMPSHATMAPVPSHTPPAPSPLRKAETIEPRWRGGDLWNVLAALISKNYQAPAESYPQVETALPEAGPEDEFLRRVTSVPELVSEVGGDPVNPDLPGPLSAAQDVVSGIRAYHGSPYKFDKFLMEKIGTGEGAQVRGHGLYFAEKEGVARTYRDTLGSRFAFDTLDDLLRQVRGQYLSSEDAARVLKVAGLEDLSRDPRVVEDFRALAPTYDPAAAVTGEQLNRYRRLNDAVEGRPKGSMYEVAIHADPEALLDLDKPILEQSPKVLEALKAFGLNADQIRRYQEISARLDEISNQRSSWHAAHPEAREEWDALVAERTRLSSEIAQQAPIPRLRPWQTAHGEDVYQSLTSQLEGEAAQLNAGRAPTRAIFKDGYYEVVDDKGQFITNVYQSDAPTESDALAEASRRLATKPQATRAAVTPDALASQRLREAGIPGAKYLDGVSRNPMRQYDVRWDASNTKAEVFDPKTGQAIQTFPSFREADAWVAANTSPGSYNYVIWDENLIEILRQYGLLGLLGGGLAAQSLQSQPEKPSW